MEFCTVRIRGRRIVHDSVMDGHYCKAELDHTQAYVEKESHTIYHTACQGIFGARFRACEPDRDSRLKVLAAKP
jgi:hypothetical protein